MLTRAHRQEALSRAYVLAVAAQAGFSYSTHGNDYGIDLSLRAMKIAKQRHVDAGVQLDLQLKCTTRASVGDTHVTYDLEVKTYDDLRDPESRTPRILVLLVLPEEETHWVSLSEEELILRHCAYWLSLYGRPPTTAISTVRITIPRTNVFSVPNLQAVFQRLSSGGEP